ncbi:glutamyl-tRNA amidotransferase subunit A [Dictyobacter sp. S3.2.2.5]|uniref:Glutamyl-tRNA amidotransferase subunit A n=1 Tax=Dictyobacter halimunensis TaxID=3026934 RepID=A0ABQ6G0P6_9CHLR|nr:glutamyl-tRNA amidotransferase subunit A [Dictyobacter sp. S3.2.2.5]
MIHSASLMETATALGGGQMDAVAYIDTLCAWIDTVDPQVHALLPEEDRRGRLQAEVAALQRRYPDPASRPPLYCIPVGVKDTFRVDGFATRAGSRLPAELFAGTEASCVRALRAAGACILGKTVTTEFAYFEPGETRNPHNLNHTPGGSSSGSVAAVAAGMCSLALGTQVIGSTIRPAAFCGIVGFKPTYGRIPIDGLVRCADSVEHVGYFTQNVADCSYVAPLLCRDWRSKNNIESLPVLGVPLSDGPYLTQASAEVLAAFEEQLTLLKEAGYRVRRVPLFPDIERINRQHMRMVFAEMARVHAPWFARYEALYRPRTVAAIREGQTVGDEELMRGREGRAKLREVLETLMKQTGIDLWVTPATPGPAPEGLDSTGSPLMNLPWTYAGLPAITVPAGLAANNLPLGLQCVGAAMADEQVLAWVAPMADILASRLQFLEDPT